MSDGEGRLARAEVWKVMRTGCIYEGQGVQSGKILRRQERDREGVWVGAGGALAPNTSSPFLLESPRGLRQHHPSLLYPPGHCGPRSLAYVAFKCWRSHKQRQQLAKARTAELGGLNKDQMHGDSSVFLDSPSSLEPCAPSQAPGESEAAVRGVT
nr:death domain-containing membrane protein NRADD-like isoform X2 [Gorilla gorilla gorilla]